MKVFVAGIEHESGGQWEWRYTQADRDEYYKSLVAYFIKNGDGKVYQGEVVVTGVSISDKDSITDYVGDFLYENDFENSFNKVQYEKPLEFSQKDLDGGNTYLAVSTDGLIEVEAYKNNGEYLIWIDGDIAITTTEYADMRKKFEELSDIHKLVYDADVKVEYIIQLPKPIIDYSGSLK